MIIKWTTYKERLLAKRLAKKEWHTWFAWRPKRINVHEVAWLTTVYCRAYFDFSWHAKYVNWIQHWFILQFETHWEYRSKWEHFEKAMKGDNNGEER